MRIQIKQTGRLQTRSLNSARMSVKASSHPLPKPPWLRIRPPAPGKEQNNYQQIRALLKQKNLHTVCTEAACPNAAECWSSGTATFMILGDTCTRACRFCNVKCGDPRGIINPSEPENLVEAVNTMKLKYVVITCVTRDDLPDGGAGQFAKCIGAIKKFNPKIKVEVLISDLAGNMDALNSILKAGPDVLAHNLETVERLQKAVRDPRAGYANSLKILAAAKRDQVSRDLVSTKTSLMLGLGETAKEITQTMSDLRATNVDIITFGQYLPPSPIHLPVKKYVTPRTFQKLQQQALSMGFRYCASGPFVRSSYRASETFRAKEE